MKTIDTKVKQFLQIQTQLKICHWQTKVYARHIAFGSTYDELDGLIDNFVEIVMGKYGRFELSDETKTIELFNTKELDLKSWLKSFKDFLISMNDELSDRDSDLLSLRDEMLALINKLQYLLTLE